MKAAKLLIRLQIYRIVIYDDIEIVTRNKIPLWMFGCLY